MERASRPFVGADSPARTGWKPVLLWQRNETVRLITDALGLSEANVKVRLLRARLQLREHLTRAFGDERTRVTPHKHG